MSSNAIAVSGCDESPRAAWRRAALLLLVLVLASAIAVINSVHRSRQMFVRLEALHAEENRLQEQWRQLLLERSALAAHARVEHIARLRLDMHSLGDGAQVVLP